MSRVEQHARSSSRPLGQVVAGAVLIRDQFGNGVGDILIDIRRSDGGEASRESIPPARNVDV